jgi:hypothetical protein
VCPPRLVRVEEEEEERRRETHVRGDRGGGRRDEKGRGMAEGAGTTPPSEQPSAETTRSGRLPCAADEGEGKCPLTVCGSLVAPCGGNRTEKGKRPHRVRLQGVAGMGGSREQESDKAEFAGRGVTASWVQQVTRRDRGTHKTEEEGCVIAGNSVRGVTVARQATRHRRGKMGGGKGRRPNPPT